MTRVKRDFTNGNWNQHKSKCAEHLKLRALRERDERIKALAASKDPKISKMDRARAKQSSKSETKMLAYFAEKPKKNNEAASAPAPPLPVPAAIDDDAVPMDVDDDPTMQKSPPKAKTCEGLFRTFISDKSLQTSISVYGRNSSVLSDSDWKIGMFGTYSQAFASACTGSGGTI